MPICRLDNEIWFPDHSFAEEGMPIAVGGDLSIERLLLAYSNGIFPWFNPGDPILWWCPQERYIIRPEKIHISKSMKKFMKKHEIKYTCNQTFMRTMHRCRMKRKDETWITDEMEVAYNKLYEAGHAMSVEAIVDGEVAGGLYGVVMNNYFCGESMYTDIENGSKLALIGLAKALQKLDFKMIDCQFHTDHLESMGGEYISYEEYMRIVRGDA